MEPFPIPQALDAIAVLLWATSGALLALERRFDAVGLFVVALVSATGGGLLRDGLLLQQTPVVLERWRYLALIVVGTLAVLALGRHLLRVASVSRLVDVIDAVAMPGYAVVGMQMALAEELPLGSVLLTGLVTGVGGTAIRDLVVGEVPRLVRPGELYGLLLVPACGVHLALLLGLGAPVSVAGWSAVGIFFAARLATMRFGWQTHAVCGVCTGQIDDSPRQ